MSRRLHEVTSFGLRSANKPQAGYWVSGVVRVADTEGKGYSYIRFSEDFVNAVGRALPTGVGPEHPAYIKVIFVKSRLSWRVLASYMDDSRAVLLWECRDRPAWVKRVRRPE